MIPKDGINIIFSPYAGKYKKKNVNRSWGERLFGLPWQLLVSTKTVVEFEPGIYVINFPKSYSYDRYQTPIIQTILAHTSFKNTIKEFGLESILEGLA